MQKIIKIGLVVGIAIAFITPVSMIVFADPYTLTLTTSGTGKGTIQTNSTGPFYYGAVVKIWANASVGSTFIGFTGNLSGIVTPQNLTFDGNESVNAAFTLNGPYTLTLTKSGTGLGTIQANRTGPFYYGDKVEIWANASVGSTFIGFTGNLSGIVTPQNLTFDGNESVNAAFTLNGPYTLTLTKSGTGLGTIKLIELVLSTMEMRWRFGRMLLWGQLL